MTAAQRHSVSEIRRVPSAVGAVGAVGASPVVAALVLVLAAVAAWRQGGFWHQDAVVVGLLSLGLAAAACTAAPPDRRSAAVLLALALFASWWLVRSVAAGAGTEFVPLGAAVLAFAAAFGAVRALAGPAREVAALGLACLGAVVALVGLVGMAWRWDPLAIPSQGLWRLSSTLTYADAAGVVLGACLLLALGCDRHPALVRVAVCLTAAGLVATQSRGAFLAGAAGLVLVPRRRLARSAAALLAGAGVGVVAVATSPAGGADLWLLFALAVGLAAAVAAERVGLRLPRRNDGTRLVVAAAALIGLIAGAALVHHELGLRALAPSDNDRVAEWSSAWHQWTSAPLVGVGPDRLLALSTGNGSVAHFAHNEYLQVGADGGLIGIGLLGAVALTLARTLRRFDVLSSCAVAALVCWAVAGAFDFDWHLPVVGLVGGWCAGVAVAPETAEMAT